MAMNRVLMLRLAPVASTAVRLAGYAHRVTSSEAERPASASSSAAGSELARKYDRMLVRRPGHSDEDSRVYVVENGRRRWITKGTRITAHGYKWPTDVHIISPEDLASIPEGDAIQVP